jgi:TonB family protein
MKNGIITFILALLMVPGFSQNSRYEYTGRFTPAIKKEQLNFARSIGEIMPEFNRYFALPSKERTQMNYLVNMTDSPPVYSVSPQVNFAKFIDYVSVEISATCNGNAFTTQSAGDVLTTKQKNILNTADLGTDILIKIKFSYKNHANDNTDNAGKIIEGVYIVTVVPDTEAEYPGGTKQISAYLTDNVFNEITEKNSSEKISQAVVNFTVSEDGDIVDAKISRTSTDPEIDKIIIDATNKMPRWKPAENPNGIKVKQVISIPFGGAGC